MLYPADLSADLIDALYARADELQQAWKNVDLAVDFDSRMIDATLKMLAKSDQQVRDCQRAKNLLSYIWKRNACRDAARSAMKPTIVSLESGNFDIQLAAQQTLGGLGEHLKNVLASAGERPAVVEAFICENSGMLPNDVIESVQHNTQFRLTATTLRQWRLRHFPRLSELARLHILGNSHCSCFYCMSVLESICLDVR